MKENEFREFLINKGYTKKSIDSRILKAKKAEEILGESYDNIVIDDDVMFWSLNDLQLYDNPKHGLMQNTLRSYYEFINHEIFPSRKIYMEMRGIHHYKFRGPIGYIPPIM